MMDEFNTFGSIIKNTDSKLDYLLNTKSIKVKISDRNRLILLYFHKQIDTYCENLGIKIVDEIYFNKVVSELIRRHHDKLDFITRGWYLYGVALAVQNIEQGIKVPTKSELMGLDFTSSEIIGYKSELIDICKEFNPRGDHFLWEEKQYNLYDDKIYSSKIELQKAINSKDIKEISKKLSNLSLSIKMFDRKSNSKDKSLFSSTGKDLLLEFIVLSKKLILSNNYKSLDFKILNKAFDSAWKAYSLRQLYNTARGDNLEDLKVFVNSKHDFALYDAKNANEKLNAIRQYNCKKTIVINDINKDILVNYGG